MILFIILSILLASSAYAFNKAIDMYNPIPVIFSAIAMMTFGILLIVHLVSWPLIEHNHNMFVAKRNAIESTLNSSRLSGSQYENATITTRVMDFNIKLAERKHENAIAYLGYYIDDRIMSVEEIR